MYPHHRYFFYLTTFFHSSSFIIKRNLPERDYIKNNLHREWISLIKYFSDN